MSSARTSRFMKDNTHAQGLYIFPTFPIFLLNSTFFSHPLNLMACYPFPDASVTACQMKNACFVHSLGLQPPGYCVPPQPLWMSMQNQLIIVEFVTSMYYAHTCELSSLSHQDLFNIWSSCRLGTREKNNWKLIYRKISCLYERKQVGIPLPCTSKSGKKNWKEHRKIPNYMLKNFVNIKIIICSSLKQLDIFLST